ncbi:GDSL-like Lipase/Acylhydrolase family protein [Micrococcales bacterium KH10]|nr:GDSL-like Lipase/Acylhydrolase family protein [Micrococcales bacterium KH10]
MTATSDLVRICVIGDELVAGAGDPRALGWTSRVVARTLGERNIELFTLAVPRENTTNLANRWQEEVQRRFTASDDATQTRLVIALGRQDVKDSLSLARSRLNLANILDVAIAEGMAPLVVGPPPGDAFYATSLKELSTAFQDVAARRRAPYVELFGPLEHHEQWLDDLAASGTDMPQQAGYGLIAWLVLHSGWRRWLSLPEDE